MNNIKSLNLYITIAFGLGGLVSTSYAYSHYHANGKNLIWGDKDLNWRAGKNSFQSGTGWREALLESNARWNEAPGNFTFGIRNWDEKYVVRYNAQNEIWFTDKQSVLDGAPARTIYTYNAISARFIEADVVFDSDLKWSKSNAQSTKTPYGGEWRPWGNTAMHEFGHALGLAHVDYEYNIMGEDWDHIHANNGKVRFYAGEDAGRGEVHLYGQTTTSKKNDLGATHWKYGNADGEYSEHIPCKVYSSDGGSVIFNDSYAGALRFHVSAGGTYQAQFTLENNGYYTLENIKVGYYISTNDNITTLDRVIKTRTIQMGPNDVYTTKYSVTIPGDLTVGQTYWLGVIVDYTGSITEYCETNNATWLQIKIVN